MDGSIYCPTFERRDSSAGALHARSPPPDGENAGVRDDAPESRESGSDCSPREVLETSNRQSFTAEHSESAEEKMLFVKLNRLHDTLESR